jgi:hypothetical protein
LHFIIPENKRGDNYLAGNEGKFFILFSENRKSVEIVIFIDSPRLRRAKLIHPNKEFCGA